MNDREAGTRTETDGFRRVSTGTSRAQDKKTMALQDPGLPPPTAYRMEGQQGVQSSFGPLLMADYHSGHVLVLSFLINPIGASGASAGS